MGYIDRIASKEKCSGGMSPAEVYKCQIDGECHYLKMTDMAFSQTTYSAKREAGVMLWLADKLNVPKLREYGLAGYNKLY